MRLGRIAMSCAAAISLFAGCRNDLKDDSGNLAAFQVSCPQPQLFENFVSPLLEKRCGMLDCHGSDYRPLRLYGKYGLRHPLEGNRTGEAETTALEKTDNLWAVCAIQPEKMNQIAQDKGGTEVNQLYIVRKVRGQEGHKGGKVFNLWDDSDECLVGWLRFDPPALVQPACQRALARLP